MNINKPILPQRQDQERKMNNEQQCDLLQQHNNTTGLQATG
jgi:hypothetical protein